MSQERIKTCSKWNASKLTLHVGAISVLLATCSLVTPDPQLKKDLAAGALLLASIDGAMLKTDALMAKQESV